MNLEPAKSGLRFWLKLSLGIVLVVFCSGFAALTVIQSLLSDNFETLAEQQFALQMRQSEALYQQEQRALSAELASATVNPRLTAAFNLGKRSSDFGRFYNDLLEELEPLLIRLSSEDESSYPFFRFIDFEGNFISPPQSASNTLGYFASYQEQAVQSSLLPLATRPNEQVDAQTRSGLLVFESAASESPLQQVLTFPMYDNLGYFMGDLLFVFPERQYLENDAAFTGYWINGSLHSELPVPDELKRVLESVDAVQKPQIASPLTLEVSGTPHLSFAKNINTDNRFPTVLLVSLFSLEPQQALAREIKANIARIGLVTLSAVIVLVLGFSRQMTRSIERLVNATRKIAGGDFAVNLPVTSKDEIGRLTQAFNKMVSDLALKERYRSVLHKITDASVAHSLTAGELELGGENRQVAVLFADIRGFTPMTEAMSPEEVVRFLNEHMSALTGVAQEHGGVVDKFIGDEIMIIFGAPVADEHAAANAINCALAMIERRRILNRTTSYPAQIGVGIATGTVLAGCIGAENRLNYTVVGPVVNLASRLCSIAKADEILFNSETMKQTEARTSHAPYEEVMVKGFSKAQRIYSLTLDERANTQ